MTKGHETYVFSNFLASLMMIIFYGIQVLNANIFDVFFTVY